MNNLVSKPNNTNPFLKLAIAVMFLLLLPLTFMQFTAEVNWDVIDFIVMGLMLFTAGSAVIIAYRNLSRKTFKIVTVATVLLFVWLWAELAVGVFTS